MISTFKDDSLDIDICKLQQTLLYDDCYLPYVERKTQACLAQSANNTVVCNGRDRGDENAWIGGAGDCVEYQFKTPQFVKELRLVFDSNLDRHFVEWLNRSFQQMPHTYPLGEDRFSLPETLIKEYAVELCDENGSVVTTLYENHLRFAVLPINKRVSRIRFIPKSTWGCEEFRMFSVEPLISDT